MKGIVFTELLEMVEDRFSLAMVDTIVERAAPASGGSYTSVGTYPAGEMFALVSALSAATATPIPTLLHAFGNHLAGRFAKGFPQFFAEAPTALAFIEHVDDYIHVEVRKLYPDAELPAFETEARSDDRLVLTYRSPRGMADLAEGLIAGVASHYGEPLLIAREDLSGGAGQVVRFTLTRAAAA